MNKLSETISREIQKEGPITFARFMELALYHPELGYYGSGNVRIGKNGDFYTSPCVSSAFGNIIANFISKTYETIQSNDFTILEIGAGKGYLALDVLDSLEKNNNHIYNILNYVIVELNQKHIDYGKNLLKKHETKLNWFKNLEDINKNITGVVVSNELFDSLPFHRLIAHGSKIKEIYIDIDKDELTEKYDRLSSKRLINYLKKYDLELVEGQEIEINLNSQKLFNQINNRLDKGVLLTVDYGSLYEPLYSPVRKKGTYKCFYKHQISDDPYHNIGNQDITADVNFSDIIQVGNSLGFKKIKYTTQGQFLIDWGIIDLVNTEKISEGKNNISSTKSLFMPDLMGNKFKVLIQEKNTGISADQFYPSEKMKISFGQI